MITNFTLSNPIDLRTPNSHRLLYNKVISNLDLV